MVYLVRHGETGWNAKGFVQGQEDIPLNLKGVQQAMDRRPVFEKHHFTKVLTSPLKRADTTARILTKNAKVDSFEVDQRLIEYDFGSLGGTPIYNPDETEDSEIGQDEEDVEAFQQRILEALAQAAITDGNVMFVSHGAVIGTLIRMLLPAEYREAKIPLPNCSVAAVEGQADEDGHLVLTLVGLDMSDEELDKMLSQYD